MGTNAASAEPRTMSIPEFAAVFGLDRSSAYELARDDRLPVPTIRVGRRLLVSRDTVERVLAMGRREPRDHGADDVRAA